MATKSYVDYEDERFGKVESDKQQAMTELEQTYAGMIDQSDKYFQDQINASKDWANTQSQLQQEQTDFNIQQIEQQKEQAHKDYVKEQSGAYVDWQKQSNEYGTEAEKIASAGLANTGFSESSQVAMYNQYQNRVAVAREAVNQAILNFNNNIQQAKLQNNVVQAEIAQEALQKQLELSLQGFQYKNNLILEQANKKMELDNQYYNRWQDVLNQINTENAFAEEQRQFEKNYELQVKQFDESIRQFNQNYELKIKEFNESIRQFNEEIARLKKKDEQEYQLEIKNLELKKQQMEEQKRQYEQEMELKREQLAEEERQFDATMAYNKARASSSSGGSSGGGSSSNKKSGGSSSNSNSGNTITINGKKYVPDTASLQKVLNQMGLKTITPQKLASYVNSGIIKTSYTNSGKAVFSPSIAIVKGKQLGL